MVAKAKKIESIITLTHVPKQEGEHDDSVSVLFKPVGMSRNENDPMHDVHVIGQFLSDVAVMVLDGDPKITEILDEWFERYGDE